MILDFIHALGYLWQARRALHDSGEDIDVWVRFRAMQILQGHAPDVAAGIRRSATLRHLRGSARKATGIVEGACRHLIKDRMELTGARWSLQGAEVVLRLLSLRASGDLEEYWRFHRRKEFELNHLSRYVEVPSEAAA